MRDEGTTANAVGLGVNVVLALTKLTVGTLAGSAALVADGFNSAGDVFATAIGMVGYQIGRSPPDEDHPFGHGNAETVAGLVIGGILFATGVYVAIDGIRALASGPRPAPEPLSALVALGTAGVKAALAVYTTRIGRKTNSPALLASAADHRADVAIALTVAAGIAAARFGAPWLDPLAAVLVGAWITRLAIAPMSSNFAVLMDASPPEVAAQVRAAALGVPGVLRVDLARVHPLGSYHVVDLEIAADGALTLRQAHDLAHQVEDHVRAVVEHVREVRVHVNPADRIGSAAEGVIDDSK
ncbi:MAG: cation diffusion facilitator family transporter [Myxococcota bacterium]